ncbi:hypothetical protein DFH07DRAFT_841614 [Mycena maculata]|uniref:Secreted protein n=1 Tax=Mycena maculata TaxID=230809 RepID=A0AAD7MYQ0_9AGAR|nr:hypothetical protein DFH07DRAFT_841614 [Mycena maculata]
MAGNEMKAVLVSLFLRFCLHFSLCFSCLRFCATKGCFGQFSARLGRVARLSDCDLPTNHAISFTLRDNRDRDRG